MSYQVERVRLLRQAGEEIAKQLLPPAFDLWYSPHDTGCQMSIVTKGRDALYVWRGSEWYSDRYEFNDRDHKPGLQPDFEFARDAIEKYFSDLKIAVDVQRRLREQQKADDEKKAAAHRAAIIERTRAAIAQ